MFEKLDEQLNELLNKLVYSEISIFLKTLIYLFIVLFLCWISLTVVKKIVIPIIHKIIKKTNNDWDNELINYKVFEKIATIIPAIIFYFLTPFILKEYENIIPIVTKIVRSAIILVAIISINAFIDVLHKIYNKFIFYKSISISGYMQLMKIIITIIGVILIISTLINQTPTYLLTGLGAIAAVLILVFQDTLLGFVASIQLSANKMVKIGDWITMRSKNADGTVLDISLNTVKVQNWDKTIVTIPTYSLVKESFDNWSGMERSGGRRIKRSININMNSVQFCSDKLLEKLVKIQLIKEYINTSKTRIDDFNKKHKIDHTIKINGRKLTNLGVFRKYIEAYLHDHPKIHNEMTFLVRQLQPTDKGIPLEIYVFSNDQEWANYESIQSDIFDHILAAISEFELQIFQSPSGEDFKNLVKQ